MRWIEVNYSFSPRSQYSYKNKAPLHGFEPLNSCMPSTAYSTAPTITYSLDISCELKSDWVNVRKQMRWIFVRNALNFAANFCKICGEMWCVIFFHCIHRFHHISYINLPQKSKRWIFVRNAVIFVVNFCKKCGEMRWNIYFHRSHRNHRISYKNSRIRRISYKNLPKNFDPESRTSRWSTAVAITQQISRLGMITPNSFSVNLSFWVGY